MSTDSLPNTVLVVSDLHMINGRDPLTGRYHPRENFHADDAFDRFLDYHQRKSSGSRLLVINGDSLDFLRITDWPKHPEDFTRWADELKAIGYTHPKSLAETLVPKERRYGLRTDHYKTVYKLGLIARGHPRFFQALGRWVKQGGRIAFIKGNHDLEFEWDLLHQALRFELARTAGTLADGPAVSFHRDSLELGNLYIEHGHRFERDTRVDGIPTIYRGEEVRFPFGSFFNKYLINQVEDLAPWLDNVRPRSRMIRTAVRSRPLTTLKILWHSILALRPIIVRDSPRNSLAMLMLISMIVIPVVLIALIVGLILSQAVRDWAVQEIKEHPIISAIMAIIAVAPWVINFGSELLRRRKKFANGEDEFGHGVYQALAGKTKSFTTMYGILGHTHRMDVQDLGTIGTTRCVYLNSGAWAPRWSEHRPDQVGWTEYSFLRLDLVDKEYTHQCLEWRDDRNEPAPAVIMGPATG